MPVVAAVLQSRVHHHHAQRYVLASSRLAPGQVKGFSLPGRECLGLVDALASYAAWKSILSDHTKCASLSSNARRHHGRSISAMCRTRPSSDSVDGGIDRCRNSSSVSPAHLMARVAR